MAQVLFSDRTPAMRRRVGALIACTGLFAVAVMPQAHAAPGSPNTGARLSSTGTPAATNGGHTYYVDSSAGNDSASGTSTATAWRTIGRLTGATFVAGDVVAFKRGQSFTGAATIAESGTSVAPIRVAAYGTGTPPNLTNPGAWNMLQLEGSYISVTQLKFSSGAVFDNADGQGISGAKYRLSGAIAVTSTAGSVSVVDNEFTAVGIGVKTYGLSTVIDHNSFHDLVIAFRGVDSGSETSYGAVGISINRSNAVVSYNDFINCRSTNSPYGADGGAMEIEGFDYTKDNINIHHNYSQGSQGFLEVTETSSSNVTLSYNLSDDYQQFLAWDTTTTPNAYLVNNNTVVRTRDSSTAFAIYYYRQAGPAPTAAWLSVRNNIFHTPNAKVFNEFDFPHNNNVFSGQSEPVGYPLADGDLIADARFVNLSGADFHLQPTSPAIDNGISATGSTDLDGAAAPIGISRDIGAYERQAFVAGGSNLVSDPSFETQTNLTTTSTPWYVEGALQAGVDVNAGKAQSGLNNAWIATGTSTSWGAIRQSVTVATNTNYRMTLWLRNSGGFDYGYVGVKTTGGAVLNEVRHGRNSGSYNRYVVTFNSGGNSQVVLMAGLWGPGSNVWEQLDNVTVVAV